MSFHELGHDLVFADELGFELFDLLDVGVLAGHAKPDRTSASHRDSVDTLDDGLLFELASLAS